MNKVFPENAPWSVVIAILPKRLTSPVKILGTINLKVVSLYIVTALNGTLTFIILTVLVVDRYLPLTCTTVPVYPDNGANDVNTGGAHATFDIVPEVPEVPDVLLVPDVPLVPEVPDAAIDAFILLILSWIVNFKSLDLSKLDNPTLTAEDNALYKVSVVCLNSLVCES